MSRGEFLRSQLPRYLAFVCICLSFFLTSFLAAGSTFVGNGGDAALLELRSDKADLHFILQNISSENSKGLCTCSASNPAMVCKTLAALSAEKVEMCQRKILKHKAELLKLTEPASNVTLEFHSGPLAVEDPGFPSRTVSAVSLFSEKRILFDRDSYLKMYSSARLALLGHEIFHLLANEGIQTYGDRGPLELFEEEWGQRNALDTFGSALSAFWWEHLNSNVRRERFPNLTKGWNRHYLTAGLVTEKSRSSVYRSLLLKTENSGAKISYAYFDELWGAELAYQLRQYNSGLVAQLSPSLTVRDYSLMLHARAFPLHQIDARLSQLFLSLGAGPSYQQIEYSLSDTRTSIKSESKFLGARCLASVNVPLLFDLWLSVGGSVSYSRIQLRSALFDVKSSLVQTGYFGGLRYGF